MLTIYKRVGKYEDSDTTWPLDKNELTKCRGVAAEIWYHNTEVSRTAECDWPEMDDGSPEVQAQKELYASSLKITLAEAERLKVKSRAFTGQPVWSGGKKWGVLLLDSLKEDRIFNRTNQGKDLEAFAIQLGAVLGRLDP